MTLTSDTNLEAGENDIPGNFGADPSRLMSTDDRLPKDGLFNQQEIVGGRSVESQDSQSQ